jgi:Flp pilus assembly protein TadB
VHIKKGGQTLTVSEVVVVAAGILTLMNLIDKVMLWKDREKAPDLEKIKSIQEKLIKIDQRIDDHEKVFEAHNSFLDKDNRRLEILEQGSRVTSKALLALLGNANRGDNTEEMHEAEKELSRYLIER